MFDESFRLPEAIVFDGLAPARRLVVGDGPLGEDVLDSYDESADSDRTRELDLRLRRHIGQIANPGWVRRVVSQGAHGLFVRNDKDVLTEDVPEVIESYNAFAQVDPESVPAPYLRSHPHVFNWLMVASPDARREFLAWNAGRYAQLASHLADDSDMLHEDALGLTRQLIGLGLLADRDYDAMDQVWEAPEALKPLDSFGMAALTSHGMTTIADQPVRRIGNIYDDRATMQGISPLLRRTSFQTALNALGVATHRGFLKGTSESDTTPSLLLEMATVSYLGDVAFEAEESGTPDLSLEPRPRHLRFRNERAFLVGLDVSPEALVAAAFSPLSSAKRKMLREAIDHKLEPHQIGFDVINELSSYETTPFGRHQRAAGHMTHIGLRDNGVFHDDGTTVDAAGAWVDWLVNSR